MCQDRSSCMSIVYLEWINFTDIERKKNLFQGDDTSKPQIMNAVFSLFCHIFCSVLYDDD